MLRKLKVPIDHLIPVQANVNGAGKNSRINILGALFLHIQTEDEYTEVMCYVSSNVSRAYMSKATCVALKLLPEEFPSTASASPLEAASSCSNDGVGPGQCSCPRRTQPPTSRPTPPVPLTDANVGELKQYLLKTFASSTFNVCHNQPLPLMKDQPPVRLLVDPKATPVAAHVPAKLPIHWREGVKEGLDRDVKLGVIRPVPVNTPSEWTMRMIVVPKHDGSPRRTVDFTPLNKSCPRQTHHTPSPWSLVATIPPNTKKTVLDVFNGYHSIPIHDDDKHLTVFLTEFGRYLYETLPQGFLAAGDAFTHRMDLILESIPRLRKCIDDCLLYDETVSQQFHRIWEFLVTCGKAGIIFNPHKFQFCADEVDFVRFTVTPEGVKPQAQYIESILNFPSPSNISDVRSWYGLINQISYSFAAAPIMEHFRHLLSPSVPSFLVPP